MFWPGREAGAARANPRKVLLELRRLDVPGVDEGPAGLRWCVDSDVRRFDEACRQGDGDTALALGHATLTEGMDGRGSSEAFAQWLAGERGALRALANDGVAGRARRRGGPARPTGAGTGAGRTPAATTSDRVVV